MRDTTVTTIVLAIFALCTPALCGAQESEAERIRRAYRQELEAYRAQVRTGAPVFLDSTRTESERLSAVDGVGSFVDTNLAENAKAIVFDAEEPPAIRARALNLVSHVGYDDVEFVRRVLSLLEESTSPAPLRRASSELLQSLMLTSFSKHVLLEDYLEILRKLRTDDDTAIRTMAFAGLVSENDQETLDMLARGLESEDGPVAPYDAVPLLGFRDPTRFFPVLHRVMLRPPDDRTRVEAILLLGGYEPSRTAIIGYLQDPEEAQAVRMAAMSTLSANVPSQFHTYALPVVEDQGASSTLRIYAIQAVQQKRATRDTRRLLDRSPDTFDDAVRRIADSPAVSEELVSAAREYVSKTDPATPR